MRPDDLTPADREAAQLTLIRVHLARIARQKWTAQRVAIPLRPAGERDDAGVQALAPLHAEPR